MALIIDSTVGGVASNSYVTEAEADLYFESRPNNEWNSLPAEMKRALLIHAVRLNDRLVSYCGSITNRRPRQTLKFPRRGCCDSESIIIDYDTIPMGVKDAQCEQALYLSIADPDATADIEYLKANVGKGAVSVEFNPNYTVQKLGEAVIGLLCEFGTIDESVKKGSIRNLRVVRC